MRVTNRVIFNTVKQNINANLQRMADIQEQLSSGKKINKASDDRGAFVHVMRLRGNLGENEQYIRNIDQAISFLDTTDSTMDDITQVVQRVRELTVQAANDSNNTSSREAISEEIGILKGQLQMLANVNYGSKYIFAGTNVTQLPCGESKWTGNGNVIRIEIGPGVTVPVNVDMQGFFGSPTGLDEGGTPDNGIFALLNGIIDDIASGESTAISNNLNTIDGKIDEILCKRASVGARVNRLELHQNRLEDNKVALGGLLSKSEDVDLSEVIMNLQMQENVYNASLSAASKIIMPSLVDFLR